MQLFLPLTFSISSFCRETLSKRKLSTKVLLPKSLEIPGSATTEGNEQAKYILCAVQNHLGTSAHGGHYVADVMDWTTGVWYEFNDEEVSILEGGPTSSFDPVDTEADTEVKKQSKTRKISGSGDAYNLFYVEQSYMAQHSKIELQDLTEIAASTASDEDGDIFASVNGRRKERYRLERE